MTTPADCYGRGERRFMEATQRWRARLLAPLLHQLSRWSVRADGVTLASLAAGLLFVPLFPLHPSAALGALAVHILLDGLDGPLARFQRLASRRGSFTDTLSDQCVLWAVVLTLMETGMLGVWPGGGLLLTYQLVVTLAMVRNALEIPYRWLVRPRFAVYAAIPAACWWWPGCLNPLCTALAGLLLVKAGSGVLAVRRAL